MLTLKLIIQGHPSTDIAHSNKWRVAANWSEISAHIVLGANRKPYAASSNPFLLLTSVDLETYNQGHPFSETTINGVLFSNGQR